MSTIEVTPGAGAVAGNSDVMAMLSNMRKEMEAAAVANAAAVAKAHELQVQQMATDAAKDREAFSSNMKREREIHAASIATVLEQSNLSSESVKALQQEQRRAQLEKTWSDKAVTAEMSSKELPPQILAAKIGAS